MSRRALALRPLVARATAGIVWGSPRWAARVLFSFAHAEASSRLDLLAAARRTPSEARRALYLRHALDETRHAQLFALRSAELRGKRGLPPLGLVRPDSEALFEQLGELGFLAFVHRGERRGRQQFESYRAHFARRGDDRMRALFDAILTDERRHESYTGALLEELAGGARGARRALRRAALWEAWRRWRRAGRALAGVAYAGAMSALYLVLAPLALALRLRPAAGSRWLPPPGPSAGEL
ncbi:MAG TPA: ferritin-like domain-containing protein [Polyangia bacterium]|nr:ferritin-like domain-containing protein [Polyangia bacterium]